MEVWALEAFGASNILQEILTVKSDNVIGFNSEYLLQDIGCTECFERPNFHFTKTLATEVCFTAQRLLGDERVWPDRTRVHLIVNHVAQFQHIDDTYGSLLVETLAGQPVVQIGTSRFG